MFEVSKYFLKNLTLNFLKVTMCTDMLLKIYSSKYPEYNAS